MKNQDNYKNSKFFSFLFLFFSIQTYLNEKKVMYDNLKRKQMASPSTTHIQETFEKKEFINTFPTPKNQTPFVPQQNNNSSIPVFFFFIL